MKCSSSIGPLYTQETAIKTNLTMQTNKTWLGWVLRKIHHKHVVSTLVFQFFSS